jgi:hypothetical protein
MIQPIGRLVRILEFQLAASGEEKDAVLVLVDRGM